MKFWMEDWQYLYYTNDEMCELMTDLCMIHFNLVIL